MAKKRTYIGHVEFTFTKGDIEQIMKDSVESHVRYYAHQFEEQIKSIAALQKKVKRLEMTVNRLTMEKKK